MSQKTKTVAPFSPTRRSVIVGGCGLAAVLAGCGSDEPDEPSADATTDGESPAETSAPPTTPPASPPPEPESDALASTADIPVGGGMVFEDKEIVVVQPTEGEFKAFTAVCTHQGCPLESIEAGEILCSQTCGHGSTFSIDDGSVVQGPSTKPIAEVPISVDGDQIVQS